jgi:hypothetical protein
VSERQDVDERVRERGGRGYKEGAAMLQRRQMRLVVKEKVRDGGMKGERQAGEWLEANTLLSLTHTGWTHLRSHSENKHAATTERY